MHMLSACVWLMQPRRDIALAMQDAPDVDVIGALNVKDQVWVLRQRPAAQTGKIQLVCVAGRSSSRMTADASVCLFQSVDETQRR